jgi:HlyD family secretion protein
LLKQGYATQELFDQQKQAFDAANAGLIAAEKRVEEAKRALEALQHDVGLYKVNIADNSLVAPRAGRIQYRILMNPLIFRWPHKRQRRQGFRAA